MDEGLSTMFSLVVKVFIVLLFFVLLLSFIAMGLTNISNYRQKSEFHKLAEGCANYAYDNNGFTMYGSGSFYDFLDEMVGQNGGNSLCSINHPCVLQVAVSNRQYLSEPSDEQLNDIYNYDYIAEFIIDSTGWQPLSLSNSATTSAEAVISGDGNGRYLVKVIPTYKDINTLKRLFGANPAEESLDGRKIKDGGGNNLYSYSAAGADEIKHLYVGKEININGKVTNYIRKENKN